MRRGSGEHPPPLVPAPPLTVPAPRGQRYARIVPATLPLSTKHPARSQTPTEVRVPAPPPAHHQHATRRVTPPEDFADPLDHGRVWRQLDDAGADSDGAPNTISLRTGDTRIPVPGKDRHRAAPDSALCAPLTYEVPREISRWMMEEPHHSMTLCMRGKNWPRNGRFSTFPAGTPWYTAGYLGWFAARSSVPLRHAGRRNSVIHEIPAPVATPSNSPA